MTETKMISNQVVDKWIKDIEDLHRSQPAPTIQYTKTMPEIDQLMQVTGCLQSGYNCQAQFKTRLVIQVRSSLEIDLKRD